MQKIANLIFRTFLLLGLSSNASELKSSHLKKFEINQCFKNGCVRSSGQLGFISQSGDMISSGSVLLEFFNTKNPIKSVHCSSFKLDLKAQFLTCDNRDEPGVASLTIDSLFEISTYNL